MILFSCAFQTDNSEPLNTITELKEFTHNRVESKLKKVNPINIDSIYGDWTVIASFFTIKDHQSGTSYGLEGRKYQINKNGKLIIDLSAFDAGKKKCRWELKSNKTVFNDGKESWHIRVKGDTMEWMQQMENDYTYLVLVK